MVADAFPDKFNNILVNVSIDELRVIDRFLMVDVEINLLIKIYSVAIEKFYILSVSLVNLIF